MCKYALKMSESTTQNIGAVAKPNTHLHSVQYHEDDSISFALCSLSLSLTLYLHNVPVLNILFGELRSMRHIMRPIGIILWSVHRIMFVIIQLCPRRNGQLEASIVETKLKGNVLADIAVFGISTAILYPFIFKLQQFDILIPEHIELKLATLRVLVMMTIRGPPFPIICKGVQCGVVHKVVRE